MESLLEGIELIYKRKIYIKSIIEEAERIKRRQERLKRLEKEKVEHRQENIMAKRPVAKYPTGLTNIGVSCYLNSLTQLLAQIPNIEIQIRNNGFPNYADLIIKLKNADTTTIINSDVCDIAMKGIYERKAADIRTALIKIIEVKSIYINGKLRTTLPYNTPQEKQIVDIKYHIPDEIMYLRERKNPNTNDIMTIKYGILDIHAKEMSVQKLIDEFLETGDFYKQISPSYLLININTSDGDNLPKPSIDKTLIIFEKTKNSYDLIGVSVNHRGGIGHYVTIIKIDDIWYYINDSYIEKKDIDKYMEEVKKDNSKDPRMLLYKKRT